jgi:hypothetical protein
MGCECVTDNLPCDLKGFHVGVAGLLWLLGDPGCWDDGIQGGGKLVSLFGEFDEDVWLSVLSECCMRACASVHRWLRKTCRA